MMCSIFEMSSFPESSPVERLGERGDNTPATLSVEQAIAALPANRAAALMKLRRVTFFGPVIGAEGLSFLCSDMHTPRPLTRIAASNGTTRQTVR
jgi:hypothetical protein